jgi:hypothetical protein
MLHNAPFQPILAHFRQAKNRQNTLKLFTIFTNLRSRQAIADALKAFSAAGWGNEYLRAHLSFNERHKRTRTRVEPTPFKSHRPSLCAAMVASGSAHSAAKKAPNPGESFIPVTLILFFPFSLPLSRHG